MPDWHSFYEFLLQFLKVLCYEGEIYCFDKVISCSFASTKMFLFFKAFSPVMSYRTTSENFVYSSQIIVITEQFYLI